jgi:uncharacterized membrane protein
MTPHTLLLLSAVLLVLFAIPLWLRRVPPNRFYGVRTRATLSDEARWYEVNARSGLDLLVAGLVMLVGITMLGSVGARWPAELRDLAAAVLLIVLLAIVSVRAMRTPGR